MQKSLLNGIRVLRILILLIGVYTTWMFIYSGIGLAIGLIYLLIHKDQTWKRHGIALMWIIGIGALLLKLIALWNASGHPTLSTIYLALGIGWVFFIFYLVLSAIILRYKKYASLHAVPGISAKSEVILHSHGVKTAFLICVIGIPIGAWSVACVDFNVMFDNKPICLWIHAPTIVNIAESFDFMVQAWDRFERVSALYTGHVSFSIQSYNRTDFTPIITPTALLPLQYTFTGQKLPSDAAYMIQNGKDNGLHWFSAQINTEGLHYLLVYDSITEQTYWSNPIMVSPIFPDSLKIFWGDLHGHSGLSDGSGTPDHYYYYARYVAGLDFAALTDHAERLQSSLGALDRLEKSTNDAYEPEKFVAFQGEEWTNTQYGHYTCIFTGDSLPKKPPLSFLSITSTDQLWATIDTFTTTTGCSAIAIPHHSTKDDYIQDWTYLNPKYVKFVEVSSVHGESLFEQRDPLNYRGCGDPPKVYTPGTCAMDALKMGYHLTLTVNSDNHDGLAGHSLTHTLACAGNQYPQTAWINRVDLPYPGGITAVRAFNCTRDSIFNAFMQNQIYACSDYGRPYLDFVINSVPVGGNSTLMIENATVAREIHIAFAQDGAPIPQRRPFPLLGLENGLPNWQLSVEIFKNGELLAQLPVNTPIGSITYLDSSAITGTSYGVENCVQINDEYYINSYSDHAVDPATLTTEGRDFYVIRMISRGQRTVYAGPIWVQVSAE